jgi:membrane protease YdiL (CAAX protease family)
MNTEFKSAAKVKLKILGKILIFLVIFFFSMSLMATLFYLLNINNIDTVLQGINLIALLLVTRICMYWFEDKKMIDIGLRISAKSRRELLSGLILPCVMLLIVFLFYLLFGFGYTLKGEISFVNDILLAFVVFIFVAFNEEIMFRGYVFQKFIELTNKYVATFLLSVCFGLAHLSNPHASVLAVINVALAGVLFSICYIKTNSLWLPISFHFSWNFVQGTVFGFPVSGFSKFNTHIRFVPTGPEWITGGYFGPEGGILVSILLIAVSLLIFYDKKLLAVRE